MPAETLAVRQIVWSYFRSNTSTYGLSRPTRCTVIVKVFRSVESANSSVFDTCPSYLLVITRVRSPTRRSEELSALARVRYSLRSSDRADELQVSRFARQGINEREAVALKLLYLE